MNNPMNALHTMETCPTISIVTPNYNYAHFLDATLTSIIDQHYPQLEYIVIDGGSTDGSWDIIQHHSASLAYYGRQSQPGQYQAINEGFARSTGEIMAWLNSDDMYCPWTLRTVASIFSSCPEVEWLTTLSPCIWDYQGFCEKIEHIPGYAREGFLEGRYIAWTPDSIGWIQQESTFWRRSLWEHAGGYLSTEFGSAGDFELWSRFYEHAELYGTPSVLGGFRYQCTQKTSNQQRYIHEAQQILARLRNRLKWSPDTRRRLARRLALDKIPHIRGYAWPLYSYAGKKIVRRHSGTPDGFWESQSYRFYEA